MAQHHAGAAVNVFMPYGVAVLPRRREERLTVTDREWRLVQYMADGYTYSEVAEAEHLATSTVKHYVVRVFDKTGVHSITELVAYGFRHGKLQ